MNLSSLFKKDFNIYIAESDMIKTILHQLSRANNLAKSSEHSFYVKKTNFLRKNSIRLIKNVVMGLGDNNKLIIPLVVSLLNDENNFL